MKITIQGHTRLLFRQGHLFPIAQLQFVILLKNVVQRVEIQLIQLQLINIGQRDRLLLLRRHGVISGFDDIFQVTHEFRLLFWLVRVPIDIQRQVLHYNTI